MLRWIVRNQNALWIILFVFLVSSLAIPYLLVREPPLLDYPNHLARTFILYHLHDPAFEFAKYFRADWKPYPYILWDLLMQALQRFLPIEIAGKITLIAMTVLLPFAVAWFVWQVNRTEIKLSFLACALSYSVLYLWGFVAYQLSVVLGFFMAGTWFWYRRRPSYVRAILFFAACLATYFAHLLGFVSVALILVLYELTHYNRREWLLLASFLMPPSLLAIWARPGLHQTQEVQWLPYSYKLHWLVGLITHGYYKALDRFLMAGLALCVLVAVVGNRELKVNRRWLVVALIYAPIMLALPDHWGDSFDVNSRLVPPFFFLCLAVFRVGRRANWIAALAVALTVLRLFNVASGFQKDTLRNAAMDRGIDQIPRNARVLPTTSDRTGVDALPVYYGSYSDYAVIRRGAIVWNLFDVRGQTPMRITYPLDIEAMNDRSWQQLPRFCDNIWSYDDDDTHRRSIETIADKAFEEGPLILYKVRKEQ